MAFARVNGVATHSGSGASSYATSALSVTAGNLLVVIIRNTNDGGTISSVTDTAGNTFTSIGKQLSVNGGAVWMYYAENVTGNASDVVTVNFSAAQTNCSVVVQQFSGGATSASLRTSTLKQGTGGASSVTSNSFSPTAGDLLVSGLDDEPAATFTGITQPSGYTLNESRTLFPAGASAYNLSATGGAQTDTWSVTGGSGHNLAMISAAFKPSGTIREISGALAAATWTLAGPFSRDHFITNALRALGYTLAGPLNRDTFVGGGANLVFGLSGRPTRPDLLIAQSGRAFDFAIFAPAVEIDVEPPPIVHVWGIQVAAPGYIADPNMFYLGVAVGNAPPAPVRGAANLNLFSVFDPGALHFDLTPKGQGLLLDLALNTRLISGTLRAAGFSLAGDGVKVILKNLSGSTGLSHTPAGNPARDAAAVPENGTTPWNPGADASWVNVRDFGATGNGVTDDTTAFRNAANTRKKLYIPAANTGLFYRLTGAVTVYNDVYGDGTMPEIRMTTVSGGSSGREDLYSCFFISGYRGVANVTFNGLYLRGAWDGGNAGEWAHGIAINNCDNIIVKYCRIVNMYGDDTWCGGYSGAGCHNIVIRNNDLFNTRRCNGGTDFCDGFYFRDNYVYKSSTYVCAVDIETDNIGTQANHNIFIEGNEWNVATQEFNTGALNFTTWPNDDHTGPATIQASAAANNRGRWTNTLTAYYPPNNPQSPNGLVSSPYGYNPIFINAAPSKVGAFDPDDVALRWTAQTHSAQYVAGVTGATEPDWNNAATNYVVNSALGNGTDQTAAIQAEFDAANAAGKNIILPYTAAGYVISTPLRVRRSISSVGGTGNKPLIRTTNVATGFTNQGDVLIVPTGTSGIYIKNLNLRSSYTNGNPGTEDPQLISLGGVTNITIDGCLLENSRGDSIGQREALWDATATVTSNVLIKNNRSINSHRCAVGLTWWANNWLIVDNYIDKDNAQDAGASFVSGIDIEPESTTGVTNIEVAYNYFSMNNRTVNPSRGADGKAVFRWQVPGNPAPGGNHYLHHNYGVFGTGFFDQGGTWTGTLVNTSNAEGPLWL